MSSSDVSLKVKVIDKASRALRQVMWSVPAVVHKTTYMLRIMWNNGEADEFVFFPDGTSKRTALDNFDLCVAAGSQNPTGKKLVLIRVTETNLGVFKELVTEKVL